jgi:hypothetical protein
MIHYHGTPITPRSVLETLAGENFCISYADPRDLKICLKIGQSLMLDNGAFSAKTRGLPFDPEGFYRWLDPILGHPHWGVVPDVIDGPEDQQCEMVATWPFPKSLGIPVWHLGLSLDYLCKLVDDWGRVCLGSSGEYWNVGDAKWQNRMDETFNRLSKTFGRLPWTHGMRMLGQGLERWPLSSADSTNVAVNHKSMTECAYCMAKRIDSENPPNHWKLRPVQENLCFT